ncbi:hypothetical protein V1527DRAFT_520616 [Lipomyces starkeyi]
MSSNSWPLSTITGGVNAEAYRDRWRGFKAAHWIFSRGTGINSRQNGLLMQNIHDLFDNTFRIDGRILDPICRDRADDLGVRDELLRWHFHQAVLANMRGAGEQPRFETDFPPGTDMIGEILSGPAAAKRMEAELLSRLNQYSTIMRLGCRSQVGLNQ